MMNEAYRSFFGFEKQPFTADLHLDEILQTHEVLEVKNRFDYTLRIGGIGVVTGEIGSGKSTRSWSSIDRSPPSWASTSPPTQRRC